MYEYPGFVYLDPEKTGSSFIIELLSDFALEPPIRSEHHVPMEAHCDRSKLYFISVRDPLDAYISLYSFGCMQQGKLYARLARKGLDHHYDGTTKGFNRWLRFALKKENATIFDGVGPEDKAVSELLGPQSYRYFRLAVPNAKKQLTLCTKRKDVLALYDEQKLPRYFIRHETFVQDICAILRGPLRDHVGDVDAAIRHVKTARPRNASERIDKGNKDFRVEPVLLDRLRDREWFLHRIFGY